MEKWFKKFTMYDESQGTIATDSTTPLLGLDNVSCSESGRCSNYDEDCKDLNNHHKCWASSRVNIDGTTYECDNSDGWCPFIHHCN